MNDYLVGVVVRGKHKGSKVIVIGEDKDLWDGKRWYEMNGNIAACKYGFRLGENFLKENRFNPYEGKTYCCDLGGESLLFHEKEIKIIRKAISEDIKKNFS